MVTDRNWTNITQCCSQKGKLEKMPKGFFNGQNWPIILVVNNIVRCTEWLDEGRGLEIYSDSNNILAGKYFWHFLIRNLKWQVIFKNPTFFPNDKKIRYGRKNTIFWSQFVYFLGNLGTALCYILFQFLESSQWKSYIKIIVIIVLRS